MKENKAQYDNKGILRIAGTGKRDFILYIGGHDVCNVRANNVAEAIAKGQKAFGCKVDATTAC